MRYIKYRAYDNNTKQYEYWSAKENKYDGIFWEMVKRPEFEPAEQYTGLKDKNGKEIYEGDICNIGELGCAKPALVEYKCGSFRFNVPFFPSIVPNLGYPSMDTYCNKVFIKCVELIGTIHNNPELLSQGGN